MPMLVLAALRKYIRHNGKQTNPKTTQSSTLTHLHKLREGGWGGSVYNEELDVQAPLLDEGGLVWAGVARVAVGRHLDSRV